jgi:DNA/RNA-binding domain of Phe-tRNA-synthetase-like protein
MNTSSVVLLGALTRRCIIQFLFHSHCELLLFGKKNEKKIFEVQMTSISFQYHPDIFERFPQLSAGVILARGMCNDPSSDSLRGAYLSEQLSVLERIGDTPLSEIPALAAWRGAFRTFGVNPTKYRSAPEALLRRLTKKGDIPFINTLVDLNNLVSIRYALPVATFDVRALELPITVHLASGEERYVTLGEEELKHPEVGEVIFSDTTGLVVARRWCWRQSQESAAKEDTTDAIFTIEAQHERGRADTEAALRDLLAHLEQYAGGSVISGMLDRDNLRISFNG